MRKYLLGGIALALAATAALAQVNYVPQVGTVSAILRVPTYSAISVGLVPASSATDIFCISNGTSRNISVRKIVIAGTAGTAITTPFLVYRRSALGTSGTAATGLALPVAVPMNTTDPASTAVLTAYTANPTVASSPILLDAMNVDLPVTTAAGGDTSAVRIYGTGTDFFDRGMDLQKNTTQQICVNLNGVSVSSGVLTISMIWQEQ